MNASTQKKINQLIEEGYEFEFGDYISKGWQLLSDNAGSFIGYTLIVVLISIVGLIIPVIGWLALIFLVGPALFAGYFYMAKEASLTGNVEVSTGFSGFRELGKIVPVWLLMAVVMFLSYLPYMVVMGPQYYALYVGLQGGDLDILSDPPSAGFWGILGLIPYYFTVSYMFAIPLAIFKDMGAWEAMEASRKIITKKWFLFFAFYVVTSLMSGIGFLLFLIGMLFTVSLAFLPLYAAFEDIVGVDDDETNPYDDDLEHLIV